MSSYNLKPGTALDTRYETFLRGLKLWNVYSQNGEDALIEAIFERIGTENKWCFECGAADGLFFSNTRRLIDQGWNAVLVECDEDDHTALVKRYQTAHQVRVFNDFLVAHNGATLDRVLAAAEAPKDIDLVVLDIDSQEYYILNSMLEYRPRVVIVEFDPNAEPMFIPELNGEGQAGHLAMRYVAEARGYEVICRTKTNLICVRKDLAPLLEDKAAPKPSETVQAPSHARHQVFAAGRWQDVDADEIEVFEHEHADAAAGKLSARVIEADTRRVTLAAAMSMPSLTHTATMLCVNEATAAYGIPLFTGHGCFWHHGLTRSIEHALAHRDKDGKPADFILTIDFDSIFTGETVKRLASLLAAHPEVDAIVPMQQKREGGELLAGTNGAVNLRQPLVPIVTGHFGLTLFRREVFEKLPKPWFLEKPSADGDWNAGRRDPDITFWDQFVAAGLQARLATQVAVGHKQEMITWPKALPDGTVEAVHQYGSEWQKTKTAPATI